MWGRERFVFVFVFVLVAFSRDRVKFLEGSFEYRKRYYLCIDGGVGLK